MREFLEELADLLEVHEVSIDSWTNSGIIEFDRWENELMGKRETVTINANDIDAKSIREELNK